MFGSNQGQNASPFAATGDAAGGSGNLFGTASGAASSGSTAPAGPIPPVANIFGGGSSNAFGGGTTPSVFGGGSGTSGGLFGGGGAAAGGGPSIFGTSTANSAPTTPNPFGTGSGATATTNSTAAPPAFSLGSAFGSASGNPAASSPFGSGGGGLFAPKPATSTATTADPKTNAQAPSSTPTPSLFGAFGGSTPAPVAAASTTPAKPLFNAFGAANPATGSTTPAGLPPATSAFAFGSTTAAAGSGTGGPSLFGLGKAAEAPKIDATTSVNSTTTAIAPAIASSSSTPNLFGAFGAAKKEEPKGSTATTAPSISVSAPPAAAGLAPGGALFSGIKSATAPIKSSPLAGSPLGAPTSNVTSPAPSLVGSGQTTSKPNSNTEIVKPTSSSVPSLLKGKSMDEIVRKWQDDLEERVREFRGLASEIAAWDLVLVANGDEISKLNNQLQQMEPLQHTIDQSLDYVESQQTELSSILDSYESLVQETLGSNNNNATNTSRMMNVSTHVSSHRMKLGAEEEREKAFKLAESLNGQLNEMGTSLAQMISEVNSLSTSSGLTHQSTMTNLETNTNSAGGEVGGSDDDPVEQITAVLNAHLNRLTWIETVSEELDGKVKDMQDRVRSAHVVLDGRGGGGSEGHHLTSSRNQRGGYGTTASKSASFTTRR